MTIPWLDIISHGQTQLNQSDIYPTGVILNPVDAEHMRLYKSTLGTYIFAPPNATDEATQIGNLTPLVTNSIPAGTFLIRDFSMTAAQIVERETS